jgi:hypothetical protein
MKGLFGSPPPAQAPLPRMDTLGMGASACILAGAALCVYNANRSDSLPTSGLMYQIAGFLVNLGSVSLPGRFDSDVNPATMVFPWPTLVSPAGFAFAIWGVIYLGELVGLVVLASNKDLATDAAPASKAWFFANVAQALWCFSFRPWALSRLWLSSACLAATAASLYASQCLLVSVDGAERHGEALWAAVAWPRSLHTGWVTAAMLVNLNAWAGKSAIGPSRALAAAVLSLMDAVYLADRYASSGLSCAGVAIAWALFAVSFGKPNGADAVALGQPALDGLAITSGATAMLAVGAIVLRRAGLTL